jgi:aryl-alcohol dehydrogenase-like predicted oxidoreductase
VTKSLEGSLARLRLDRVDIFHLHDTVTKSGGGEALDLDQIRPLAAVQIIHMRNE